MNILLIAMPDIHPFFRTWKAMTPSLALASIAGNLSENHTVRIADLVLKRGNVRKAVLEAVERTRPDTVGLSAMSFQYDTAVRVARMIKGIDPRIKTVLGGYHATLMFESIATSADAKHFDFIMRGEGDKAFDELVRALEGGRPLDVIGGLSHKKNGAFIHNAPRPLEDISSIKYPNRNVRLWKGYHFFGAPFDTIESSRGCLMTCSFCSIRQMYGKSFRPFAVSRVVEDIGRAKKKGVKCLFFADDNITLDAKRFGALLDLIVESGHNDISYVVQASSSGIASSPELAEKMARAGFRFVFLGIESFTDGNLSALKKGDISGKSVEAIRLLQASGIHVSGGLIIGNPDDTAGSIEANYKFARSLGIASIYDQILTPYLKTEVRDELLAKGLVTNKEGYKFYNGHFANVRTRHMSSDDLNVIKYKMVQKYSPSFLEESVRWRKVILKHYLKFAVKLIPFGIRDHIGLLIKKLYMNERGFFEKDYARCVQENVFNLP